MTSRPVQAQASNQKVRHRIGLGDLEVLRHLVYRDFDHTTDSASNSKDQAEAVGLCRKAS